MRLAGVTFAAIAGFAVGFLGAFVIGVSASTSSECDGVCFEKLGLVLVLAFVAGAVTAVVLGVAAKRLADRVDDRG